MPERFGKRRTVEDILGGGSGNFNDLFNSTQPAPDDFEPIPAGTYRCLVADGKISPPAKTGSSSYKIEFLVLDGAYRNRKFWLDSWLTKAALPRTKRDLLKLGINSREAMDHPLRSGIVADVKVALRTEDDGRQHNRVNAFKVVEDAPPPGTFDPDEDETDNIPF